MARTFNGTSDTIHMAISTAIDVGFGTFAMICRRAADSGVIETFMTQVTSGNAVRLLFRITAANIIQYANVGTVRGSTITLTAADGWALIAAGKATGASTPRFHKYVYDTRTWSHADTTGGTLGNATAPGTTGTLRIATRVTTDYFGGDIALAGFWAAQLTDDEVEQLPFTLTAWLRASGLWLLHQSDVALPVIDLTGNGANQIAISGTSVTSTSPPFSLGAPVIVATREAALVAGSILRQMMAHHGG